MQENEEVLQYIATLFKRVSVGKKRSLAQDLKKYAQFNDVLL
jgi:hypothetical protein